MSKVGIIVGSLREKSFNKSVAEYIASQLPADLEPVFLDYGKLEIYNQDLDDTPTEAWEAFRAAVRATDALLFVTPEYNRSIPGGLKNALDVGSRPYGHSVWAGKPGGIVSVSPGAIGGFGASQHLRQILSFLNVYTLQQPEAYVGHVTAALNDNGELVGEDTQNFLKGYVAAFVEWVGKF